MNPIAAFLMNLIDFLKSTFLVNFRPKHKHYISPTNDFLKIVLMTLNK